MSQKYSTNISKVEKFNNLIFQFFYYSLVYSIVYVYRLAL